MRICWSAAATATIIVILIPQKILAQDGDMGPSSLKTGQLTDGHESRPVQFISPLKSLTLFDHQSSSQSPRSQFLSKFRIGLKAEKLERESIRREWEEELERDDGGDEFTTAVKGNKDGSWADLSAEAEKRRIIEEEARVERAHDFAIQAYNNNNNQQNTKSTTTATNNRSKYQFVGIVNPTGRKNNNNKNNNKSIVWYARPKPKDAEWSVRLLYIDRHAVLRQLFTTGKIDIYSNYVNQGKKQQQEQQQQQEAVVAATAADAVVGKPLLEAQYTVKKRSWRTLWNFNPISLITDSSGMFWRERRLAEGLYTDGRTVFESTYRYTDGRNGMKPISGLGTFLNSTSVSDNIRKNLLDRLMNGSPDVVVEQ